ncbi:hypothetical protein J2T16_004496 [Paenibacillus intestini]|uniref:Uncharacterized protein n=1 Tax=Paenibacillus cucumis (ex Kampfer et al. 2016) TaxID=1776858 RepID=A0ABS7KEA3_9BACL|nr:hypothetical protein [Paenibacillus cucumis (ex Kampfer et al. 2016)]MBY0202416.1 hypothetical protein [Paenibacillus cucumis (ex Kampfer et al. 2016)]MDP9701554.1 hypothetical protein [Paenibacillus intestini]
MGVSKKHKRSIIRANRLFFWYVKPDLDDEGIMKLHIISEDRKFIVAYEVGQCIRGHLEVPMLVIIGKEFEGWTADYMGHRRVRTPVWNDGVVTPRLIGKIIDWCLMKDKEVISLNWKGEIIALDQRI